MKNRTGFSLIILAITIVISVILLSITVIAFDKNADNAAVAAFAEDIKQIEDFSTSYIIENGNNYFTETLTLDEVKNLVGVEMLESFEKELQSREGNNNNIKFYKVDLSKIGVSSSNRGTEKYGENDIYVLTSESFHAYYLKGITVNNITYFSVSNKVKEVI